MDMDKMMSSVRRLVKKFVQLDYCDSCCVPNLPTVDGVLYVAQMIEEPNGFRDGRANGVGFMQNCLLVATAVYTVVDYDCREEKIIGGRTWRIVNVAMARKVVARAIIEMLPDEAKCLFVRAFTDALEILGENPELTGEGSDRDKTVRACTCPKCREMATSEGFVA